MDTLVHTCIQFPIVGISRDTLKGQKPSSPHLVGFFPLNPIIPSSIAISRPRLKAALKLVMRVVAACTESHNLAVPLECTWCFHSVEKTQEEGEPITTHDGAEGESCEGPRCNPAILDGWETYRPHYDDQSEEPL